MSLKIHHNPITSLPDTREINALERTIGNFRLICMKTVIKAVTGINSDTILVSIVAQINFH